MEKCYTTSPRKIKGGVMANICNCSSSLTPQQLKDLQNGKAVFCSVCKRMMWIEKGKLQTREPHFLKEEK